MLYRFLIAILISMLFGTYAKAEPTAKIADRFTAAPAGGQPVSLQFKGGADQELSLKDYRGRYVLLNIWASWCGPCVKEMPGLDRLQASLTPADNLAVIALAEDRNGSAVVPAFYRRQGLPHLKVFTDTDSAAMWNLHLRGLPTTLLLDPDGREIGRVDGDVDWDSDAARSFLRQETHPHALPPKPHMNLNPKQRGLPRPPA